MPLTNRRDKGRPFVVTSMTRYRVHAFTIVSLLILAFPRIASAVPSYARQTGMPCSQCHTLSFGPALTAYGRQFKLNGYTFGEGEHPLPVALMIQGGFSHTDVAPPDPQAAHFAPNNNVSVDQVSLFVATRLTEHVGMFSQATYSGEARHFNWDNTDIRYARPLNLFGTDAIVGISLNNNPTVQDLWTSTPAWSFPYITSPLVPGASAGPVIDGALAQGVVGATAYTMIHDHVYLEAGAYRGLSDRWLGNVGLYPDNNLHINGGAPYWRAAYQFSEGGHYFSVGTYGLDVKMQPDPTVPATDRYTDIAFDATYQYTPQQILGNVYDIPGAIQATLSYTHEKQALAATFGAGGADNPSNHLNSLRFDVTYAYRQTWSAGLGGFDITGGKDLTLYGSCSPDPTIPPAIGCTGGPFTGSANGSPNTRGYVAQFECVPLGKMTSWGRPWVNLRLGLQYTGYLKFNGGTSNYDGFGRNASQNNSLFLFSWMAF